MKKIYFIFEKMADARKAAKKKGYKSTSSEWCLVNEKGGIAHICYDPEMDMYGIWYED